MNCRYCKIDGHEIQKCPKLDKKKEREKEKELKNKKYEDDFPSVLSPAAPIVQPVFAYASVLTFKKDKKMIEIEKQEIERKKAEKEAHEKVNLETFLLREEGRARKRENEERRINNTISCLKTAFPFTWFTKVENTEFDTDYAERLRDELDRREYDEEERMLKEDREQQEMLAKMTPNELEKYFDDIEPDLDNYYCYDMTFNHRRRGISCKRCNNLLEYDNRSQEECCFRCVLAEANK
jgi:hypothetical protein